MFLFDDIPPKQFVLLSTLLGLILTDILNDNEQNSFGNFLINLGQALVTNTSQIQTQKAFTENQQQYNKLCNQICLLNEQLEELKRHYR